MHTKTDSDGTSVDTSWPLRSPPRRPVYYVQSPSNHDVEKMSYGSSPTGSPPHHFYHCSPIHHSRESSTSRFSASLKNPKSLSVWKHVQIHHDDDNQDDDDDMDGHAHASSRNLRLYFCGFLVFVLVFTIFCFILWGASKAYTPQILVKNMVFENLNLQAGNDGTGVPTDMLTINSTVRIRYKNRGTFFAVHVTTTPLELHYYQLKIASGQIQKFTEPRKRHRTMTTVVGGKQIPLYGGLPLISNPKVEKLSIPLNLTFVVRSRAYILGRLVQSKFYNRVRCHVILHGPLVDYHLLITIM
ncbi:Late embryogenesis abundant (LEA) hydroxyproline-rich glycoprotein family [Euphorbia peplus]|nr:Late embryogenesis abundant (LEA) hydroxyproline-rich glycoprotein family [Euphorbia peplus]